MSLKNQAALITYPDSLGGDLKALYTMLTTHFAGLFAGVHILPFYPSSGDRGFAPVTYREVEPRFGSWEDVRRIAAEFQVMADLMVNHISRRSAEFRDFARQGRRSSHADLFLTLDKVWPGGNPPPEDVAKIFFRKPQPPFSDIRIEETGEIERVWTTFGTADWSEQIDLDVRAPATREFLRDLLQHLAGQSIKIVRLDAVGYVIKKPGTSCFFVEPDIYEFLDGLRDFARSLDLELLPEVHAPYSSIQAGLAARGYWVYDFVLPLLVLHTLFAGSSRKLCDYLRVCPRRQFTALDTHDGIPVQPDLEGILEVNESRSVVNQLLARGANLNRLLSPRRAHPDFDAHQVNCTYYSALDRDDDKYLAARAIQLFAPGIPQIYYTGLLAGENDYDAVQATGEGRAINRHTYTVAEIEQALQRPAVQRLLRLIRFRNRYPAFDGDFHVLGDRDDRVQLRWESGDATCALRVDLRSAKAAIEYRDEAGRTTEYRV